MRRDREERLVLQHWGGGQRGGEDQVDPKINNMEENDGGSWVSDIGDCQLSSSSKSKWTW